LSIHAQSSGTPLESYEMHPTIPYRHYWLWFVHMSKK